MAQGAERDDAVQGDGGTSNDRSSSSVLILLKAPGSSSKRTSATARLEYQASILRPPPARNAVSPGRTLLRQRQNTGWGWSPVLATARAAFASSSAVRSRATRSCGRNGESHGTV